MKNRLIQGYLKRHVLHKDSLPESFFSMLCEPGYHVRFHDVLHHVEEIDVWFNKQAEWVMTETDVESLEKVPAPVAEAFMSSTMTGMRLRDIRIITFPKHPTVIIIEVEQYNSDEEFQLFYAPDGKLLQSLDVTELGGEIYPGLFFND